MKIFPQGVSAALVMLSLTVVAWAGPNHPATEYVEGDAIVTFKPSVNLTIAQQMLAGAFAGVANTFRRIFPAFGENKPVWCMPTTGRRRN